MVRIETCHDLSVELHPVEIVERKGRGHPDHMCDGIVDAISVALSQEYLRQFGTVLHHNIDKSLLAAGRVDRHFGGGSVITPMELTIGDRATFRAGGKDIDVEGIAVAAARDWIARNLRFVDPDRHLTCRTVLAAGSEELSDIFSRPGAVRGANDTSAAVGYYPYSATERAVLELEGYLNGPDFKARYPDTGEDVKVMALRLDRKLEVTVAMPLIASHIGTEDEYFRRKRQIHEEMSQFVAEQTAFTSSAVVFNGLDMPGRGLGGVYLSLLGTSAEDADSGQVGRGNRVNGVIAFNRPIGTEAAAGKNGVSHVGKIYNVLAHRIAREIYTAVAGVREVTVHLLSRIGAPVNRPQLASARLILEKGAEPGPAKKKGTEVIARELADLQSLCSALGRGDYPVC